MKRMLCVIRENLIWLVAILVFDMFFALGLWVTSVDAFVKIMVALVLFSIMIFVLICLYLYRRDIRREKAFIDFLSEPDVKNKDALIYVMGVAEKNRIELLYKDIIKYQQTINEMSTRIEDYEEYVEAWTHEAKTPIALLTLLMDNHKLGGDLDYKLEYIRCRLNESVEQMLQYSRIKSSRKDYLLERNSVGNIIKEVLEDYEPLLSEKDFMIINKVKNEEFLFDKRGLKFMLGQFVTNSIKYSDEDPELVFEMEDNKLLIRDNGIGVKECDQPYIFEKGFTGNTGDYRGKATGMGLYLAKKIAEDMSLKLGARSPEDGGFEISVVFPVVEQGEHNV